MRITVVGERNETYPTHRELDAALLLFPADVAAAWVRTDDPELGAIVESSDGIWLAPGTPYADNEAAIDVITHARTGRVPFLATCGGFQYSLLEFARNVAGITEAAHAEVDPASPVLAVAPLACSLVGVLTSVQARSGTRLAAICGDEPFDAMHWCNFGPAAELLPRLKAAGLSFDCDSAEAGPEGMELHDHPFFIATLFQPQWGSSTTTRLHPLIDAFLEAARAAAALSA